MDRLFLCLKPVRVGDDGMERFRRMVCGML